MKHNPEETEPPSLAERFAAMRREDRQNAPPFPEWREQGSEVAVPALARFRPAIWALPAAAALVIAVILLRPGETSDPGVLYQQVMAGNTLETDTLLAVSPGTLPELGGPWSIMDFDLPAAEMRRTTN